VPVDDANWQAIDPAQRRIEGCHQRPKRPNMRVESEGADPRLVAASSTAPCPVMSVEGVTRSFMRPGLDSTNAVIEAGDWELLVGLSGVPSFYHSPHAVLTYWISCRHCCSVTSVSSESPARLPRSPET
jgi:hypothetical protein